MKMKYKKNQTPKHNLILSIVQTVIQSLTHSFDKAKRNSEMVQVVRKSIVW